MHPSDCKMSLSLALLAIQAERVPLFLPCEPRTLKEKRLCYADYAPGFLSAACRHVESPQVDLKALAALADGSGASRRADCGPASTPSSVLTSADCSRVP